MLEDTFFICISAKGTFSQYFLGRAAVKFYRFNNISVFCHISGCFLIAERDAFCNFLKQSVKKRKVFRSQMQLSKYLDLPIPVYRNYARLRIPGPTYVIFKNICAHLC